MWQEDLCFAVFSSLPTIRVDKDIQDNKLKDYRK